MTDKEKLEDLIGLVEEAQNGYRDIDLDDVESLKAIAANSDWVLMMVESFLLDLQKEN